MAANDPGLATFAAPAEDPTKGAVLDNTSNVSDDRPVAPDQFDPKYETSQHEIWAYYSYYIGNNGLSLFNFAPTAAQNLLYQHAEAIGGEENTIVFFAGANRTINSVILLCNGISFAIQAVLFLIIGAYADFGTFRPYILIGLSILAWGIGFGWLGVHEEPQWQYGLGLYIVGLIAYQMCLTYWTAAFPGLARNTPHLREMAEKFERGDCTREEYDHEDSMKRNELSNVAFYVQSVAEIVILAVIVGIMFGLNVNASTEANNWGLSVLIAFASGVWLLVALPWFFLEKRRPGQDPGMNIVLAGFWQLYRAAKEVWQLKQSLFYLIGMSFANGLLLLALTCRRLLPPRRLPQYHCHRHWNLAERNRRVQYTAADLSSACGYRRSGCGHLVVLAHPEALSIVHKDDVQCCRCRDHSARWLGDDRELDGPIWCVNSDFISSRIFLPTNQTTGFHNAWELWVYQTFYGLFVCPWYTYSQTMISEVTPRGKEFLFFSLFSIIGKTSSFIGPFVTSAIIVDADNNNSAAFYFLFALSLASFLFMLFFVNVPKSRIEQAEFLERERIAKEKLKGGSSDLS